MGEAGEPEPKAYSGRITAIAFSIDYDRQDTAAMFIGTEGGGIWRSTDFREPSPTWQPLTDNLPVALPSAERAGLLAISSIAVDVTRPWTLYAGTSAAVILKSTDGGDSWEILGHGVFSRRSAVSEIVINPLEPGTIYALGGLPTSGVEDRIAKSLDGGKTWLPNDVGPKDEDVVDMEYGLFSGGRRPGGFYLYANVRGQGIYESADGAGSWSPMPMPGSQSPGTLALAASNPGADPDMYAVQFGADGTLLTVLAFDWNTAAWRPVPGGRPSNTDITFGPGTGGSSGFAMGVAPDGTIYLGVKFIYVSLDGGATWHRPGEGHVDQHAWGFLDDSIYNGNDGGIWRFVPVGRGPAVGRWESLSSSSLQTHLVNSVSLAPLNPGIGLIGSQDNGSALRSQAQWSAVGGGDGGLVRWEPDPARRTAYRTYWPPTGGPVFERTDDGGQTWHDKSLERTPALFVPGDARTSAPRYAIDPRAPDHLVMGYHAIYRTTDRGEHWQAFSDLLEGQAAVTALGSIGGSYFAGYDNGRLWRRYGGSLWTPAVPGAGPDFGSRVTGIAVRIDPSAFLFAVYVTAWGDADGETGRVWRSPDGGETWAEITGNLASLGINAIDVYTDPVSSVTWLFAGTAAGVFATSDPGGSCWIRFGTGMPDVQITDLQIYPEHRLLAAATYGRGVFIADPSGLGVPVPPAVTIQFAEAANPVIGSTAHFSLETQGVREIVPLKYAWAMLANNHVIRKGFAATFSPTIPDSSAPILVRAFVNMDGCELTASISFVPHA